MGRIRSIGSRAIRDLERLLLLEHMSGFQKLLEGCFIQRRLFLCAYDLLLQVPMYSRLV